MRSRRRPTAVASRSTPRPCRSYVRTVRLSCCQRVGIWRVSAGERWSWLASRSTCHAYLRRLDFFKAGAGAVVTDRPLRWTAELRRSSASLNVLELSDVHSLREVYDATARALQIVNAWLDMDAGTAQRVACCIAEACENVIEHSQDSGVVVAQKYEFATWTEVQLAIADLGIGIRQSLGSAHTDLEDTPAGWIRRAVAGLSCRAERGGLGLGEIRRIATQTGGSLLIRSGPGRAVYGRGYARYTDRRGERWGLPGTQLAVTLRKVV